MVQGLFLFPLRWFHRLWLLIVSSSPCAHPAMLCITMQIIAFFFTLSAISYAPNVFRYPSFLYRFFLVFLQPSVHKILLLPIFPSSKNTMDLFCQFFSYISLNVGFLCGPKVVRRVVSACVRWNFPRQLAASRKKIHAVADVLPTQFS